MARIPTPEELGYVQPTATAQVSTADASGLAAGVASLGASLSETADRAIMQRNVVEIANAEAQKTAGLLGVQRKYENDPNYQQFASKGPQDTKAVVQQAGQAISDPRMRAKWNAEAGKSEALTNDHVFNQGIIKEKDAQQTVLSDALEAQRRIVADPNTPEDIRQKTLGDMRGTIDMAEKSGLIMPDKASTARTHYIEGGIFARRQEQAVNNPDQIGRTYAGLDRENGFPVGYLGKTRQVESDGNPNNVTAGNVGEFQYKQRDVDRWVKPGADVRDPQVQLQASIAEGKAIQGELRKALGRDPTGGEMYLAKQQGIEGAKALLLNPDKPAVEVLSQFNGPKEGKAEDKITGNSGSLGQTAGQFAKTQSDKWDRAGGVNDVNTAGAPGRALSAKMTRENWNLSFYKPEDMLAPTKGGSAVDTRSAIMADTLGQQFFKATGVRVGINDVNNAPGTEGKRRGASDPADNPHVPNSEHLKGTAFDFQIQNLSPENKALFLKMARETGFSGVGFYDGKSGHLHLDAGNPRQWGNVPDWAAAAMGTPVGKGPSSAQFVADQTSKFNQSTPSQRFVVTADLSSLSPEQRLQIQNTARAALAAQESTALAQTKLGQEQIHDKLNFGIAAGDPSVTKESIFAYHNSGQITDDHATNLLKAYEAQEKHSGMANSILTAMANGEKPALNPYDPDVHKGMDRAYDILNKASGPGNELANVDMLHRTTGVVPPKAVSQLRGAMIGTDATAAANAMQISNDLMMRNPNVFTGIAGGDDLARKAAMFSHRVEDLGYSAADAAKMVQAADDPGARSKVKITDDEAKSFTDSIKKTSLLDQGVGKLFDRSWWPGNPQVGQTDAIKTAMLNDFSELALDYYKKGYSQDDSKAAAARQLRGIWGVTNLQGTAKNGTVMKYPPELRYPAAMDSTGTPGHEYIREQAVSFVKEATGKDVDKANIIMMPVPTQTAAAWGNRTPVPYQILYGAKDKETGQMVYDIVSGKSFTADPAKANNAVISKADATNIAANQANVAMRAPAVPPKPVAPEDVTGMTTPEGREKRAAEINAEAQRKYEITAGRDQRQSARETARDEVARQQGAQNRDIRAKAEAESRAIETQRAAERDARQAVRDAARAEEIKKRERDWAKK